YQRRPRAPVQRITADGAQQVAARAWTSLRAEASRDEVQPRSFPASRHSDVRRPGEQRRLVAAVADGYDDLRHACLRLAAAAADRIRMKRSLVQLVGQNDERAEPRHPHPEIDVLPDAEFPAIAARGVVRLTPEHRARMAGNAAQVPGAV